jgi:hypothetical protein
VAGVEINEDNGVDSTGVMRAEGGLVNTLVVTEEVTPVAP